MRRNRFRRGLLSAYRAAVFAAVIVFIRLAAQAPSPPRADVPPDVSIASLRKLYPSAASLSPRSDAKGAHVVNDSNGNALGFVIATSPESDAVIGYSGPSETLVAFGADSRVIGVEILSSGDTPEHLAQVVEDPAFLSQFEGKTWQEMQSLSGIDGVSGATLTSLAIAEGIMRRTGGEAPSLRFPKPLSVEDAQRFFPSATRIIPDEDQISLHRVNDSGDQHLGYLTHSSPHSDNLIGYRGPSDVLIALETDASSLRGIALRDTYDTDQYVGYVTEDPQFLKLFDAMTLAQLNGLDLDAIGVEGVSGATMTSRSIAASVIAAATKSIEIQRQFEERSPKVRVGADDVGTALVLAFGLLMAFSKLRGRRRVRIAFQVVLIAYLGLINGQLLSQALFVGWASQGLGWQFSPGLILLAAAALLIPLAAAKNVYCHQICPHGAAQQLLKRARKRKLAVPRKLAALLRLIPIALLLVVVIVAMRQLAFNLVQLEPFDAYLWRAAGWATLTIAAIGLIASIFVPMAYCRYGCPTGALLNFLAAGGRPDRFSRRDSMALAFLLLAAGLYLSR